MTDSLLQWVDERVAELAAARTPPDRTFEQLPAEASFRSFYRYRIDSKTSFVVMVSPPDKEQNRQFEATSEVFGRAGIPVPRVLARHPANGWYVLNDLGSVDLEHAYETPDRDAAIQAAIDCLVRLQTVNDPVIGPYTRERFSDELGIFREWFVGRSLPTEVEDTLTLLVDRAVNQPQCCIHRDYHCRNLLYENGRLGVVDFQDALMGPASYDLASLLHDCYHEFPDDEVERWIDYYLSKSQLFLKRKAFAKDLAFVAVQRQLKAVGIFARLKLRDAKSSHLAYIEPVIDRVRSTGYGVGQAAAERVS